MYWTKPLRHDLRIEGNFLTVRDFKSSICLVYQKEDWKISWLKCVNTLKWQKMMDTYLKKKGRGQTMRDKQIQMGIQAHSFSNKNNLTEDETASAKTV